jgi:hypothetical protein
MREYTMVFTKLSLASAVDVEKIPNSGPRKTRPGNPPAGEK